ncbi:MAG TPA: glycosyltransferase family 2 protein [Steroidobacteraceae bacterium]|jgi:succinoglycan biosynthesis protein ExoM
MKVSVCIATYRRVERLRAVLEDLARQSRVADQVVVVDNDQAGGARALIEQLRATNPPFALVYEVQPQRNIAATRNLTVKLADGEWLAFIDDDERAPTGWLQQLLEVAAEHHADGVLAPVEPQLPDNAPAWIRRGRFYDFPHLHTGQVVPLNRMRFGNVLLRAAPLRAEPGPFDTRYGLSTGEDGDLLVRLARKGQRIIWCDEAIVWEPIEARRLSLHWLLMRALSGGQEFARQTVNGRYGPISWIGRGLFFCRALLQLLVAAVLALLCWPAGPHRSAQWLITASANLGKLSVFWGWRYRAYA